MTVARSATWSELVPVAAGDVVLLPVHLDVAAPAFTDRGADATAGSATSPVAGAGVSADVVVVDGRRSTNVDIENWVAALGDGGRLVVIAPNRWSPLRLYQTNRRQRIAQRSRADQALGDPNVRPLLRLGSTVRRLESDARVAAVHPIALFPGLEATTSAYRMDIPPIAELVLRSVSVGAGRTRRSMLGLLRRSVRFGFSRQAPPAWMLIVYIGRATDTLVPTGRIGVAANEQGVVLLGTGPDQIEKQYRDAASADRIRDIHQELTRAGLDIVAPVRGHAGATRLRFDWVSGTDIDEADLTDDELAAWSGRAAAVLGRIHGATLHEDGTVLTHGDFWLGALIANGQDVVGVIDWTDGGRARPAVDISVLTKAVHQRWTLDAARRDRILDRMQRLYEEAGGPPGLRFRGGRN